MNLQHQRIVHLCEQLRFVSLADRYSALAQSASSQEASDPDFLEQALDTEVAVRQARSLSTLARLADFPAIKVVELRLRVRGRGRSRRCWNWPA